MLASIFHFKHWILIVVAIALTLVYVRVRLNMYQVSYQMNENLKIQEDLMVKNKKLKIEAASLKSPARIQRVASGKNKLKMDPDTNIIVIKTNDSKKK